MTERPKQICGPKRKPSPSRNIFEFEALLFRSVDSRVVLSKQQESANQKDNVRDRRQKGRRLIISSDENVSHMCGYDYVAWHGTGYHVSKTAA